MPRVTDLWFTSLTRIILWRSLCAFSVGISVIFLAFAPILYSSIKNFGAGWRVAFVLAPILVVVSAQRWHHWRQVQKANIFPD